jgi:NADH dehydrogenase
MYRSLHKMHDYALHGGRRVVADTIARTVSRRPDRVVKLH